MCVCVMFGCVWGERMDRFCKWPWNHHSCLKLKYYVETSQRHNPFCHDHTQTMLIYLYIITIPPNDITTTKYLLCNMTTKILYMCIYTYINVWIYESNTKNTKWPFGTNQRHGYNHFDEIYSNFRFFYVLIFPIYHFVSFLKACLVIGIQHRSHISAWRCCHFSFWLKASAPPRR